MGLPRRWRAADLLRAAPTRRGPDRAGREGYRTPGAGDAACDLVVDAGGLEADESLAQALRALGAEVHAIGDCRGPRYLEAALLEAARLALVL